MVAYEGDSTVYDAILTPLCNTPPTPPLRFASGAHSHSLVDGNALIWKVVECSCISKFAMYRKASHQHLLYAQQILLSRGVHSMSIDSITCDQSLLPLFYMS